MEMVKTAISAGLALKALRARIAQGVRVAPKLLRGAEEAAAAGARSTPAAVRRTALGAADSGQLIARAAGRAERVGLGAERSALANRARTMDKAIARTPSLVTSPVVGKHTLDTTRALSPGARRYMVGEGSIAQAKMRTFQQRNVYRIAPSPAAMPVATATQSGVRSVGAQGATRVARNSVGATGLARPQVAASAVVARRRPLPVAV